MLILTRREGEEIVINNNIILKVLSIDGARVKLGIEAPRDVPIRRAELEDEQPEDDRDVE